MVVHVRSKEPRTLLALRRHMSGAAHCTPPVWAECEPSRLRGSRARCALPRISDRVADHRGVARADTDSACDAPAASHCALRSNRSGIAACEEDVDIALLVRSDDVRQEASLLKRAGRLERQRLAAMSGSKLPPPSKKLRGPGLSPGRSQSRRG